jgi:hypothetical protein
MRLGQEISCTWSSGTPCGDVCDRIIVVFFYLDCPFSEYYLKIIVFLINFLMIRLPYDKGDQYFTSSPKPDELN